VRRPYPSHTQAPSFAGSRPAHSGVTARSAGGGHDGATATLILYRAGVDLDKARGLLVTMAAISGRTATSFLDSHPAGPERVAAWDRAVAEIRASHGRLPQRAS
jgi:hypothetical protein